MKKLRLYLDTSVIGGCFDKEFEKYSSQLVDDLKDNKVIALISEVIAAEISKAPPRVQDVLEQILNFPTTEEIILTSEMTDLAAQYLSQKVIPQKFEEDALHIAIATVAHADALISWNFKHIVNMRNISLFNSVNLKEGYPYLDIRSPMEVIQNDDY